MMRRTLANAVVALVVVAAAACSSEREAPASVENAPVLNLAEAEVVGGGIVVDFKDGTTKAEFDAWEADWGVDLELNSVESADEALTLAVGVDDVEGALARIRQHPAVEAAEPLMEYRSSFVPNDP
ncbi:MAG TPA: peptidase S8, partial [Myxococcaceae bacterium]